MSYLSPHEAGHISTYVHHPVDPRADPSLFPGHNFRRSLPWRDFRRGILQDGGPCLLAALYRLTDSHSHDGSP